MSKVIDKQHHTVNVGDRVTVRAGAGVYLGMRQHLHMCFAEVRLDDGTIARVWANGEWEAQNEANATAAD